ncbi:hypothetical protein Tco_0257852 [Tanacetum coccineum]
MSSITTQQTKLDLELVPKENRLDISKCNGRIPRGLTLREPTFQVFLDAIALTPCYPAFLITADVPEVYMHQFWNSICPRVQGRDFDALPSEEDIVSFLRELGHTGEINSLNDIIIDQMHQPWRTFIALINRGLSGKTSGLDKLRLSRAQILWGLYYQKNIDYVELLWEDFVYQIDNRVYKKQEKMMHTSKDDYLINSLRFVSAKESTQIYGAILPECLTSPALKESKAYKTYLGYATCDVPPKIARKFKKSSPSKKESDQVPGYEEPVTKGKQVKRSVKKSTTKPTTGIVIREPPVETKSKRKEKEMVDVAYGKGIELLSDVALSEEAQMKELREKSLRDFQKTHPSGSGTVAEKPLRVDTITPTVISEGTSDKPGVLDVTKDDSTESEYESWGNDEDDSNNEQESSDERSKQENESEEQEYDSEQQEESDDDDQKDEEFDQEEESEDDEIKSDEERGMDVHGEGTDAEMNDDQQGNENLVTTQEQVVEDAHVTISTVSKKTEVLMFMSTMKFQDLRHQLFLQYRILALEKEVAEIKKDPLHTQVTTLIDEHLDTRLGETREEFIKFLLESLTARIKEQVKDQLPQIMPKEVSNLAPPMIEKMIEESQNEVTLAKVSSQPQSSYEDAATLTKFELKKILIDKIEKSESYLAAPEDRDCYDSLKKSYDLDKDFFSSYDVYSLKRGRKDKDKDEDPSAGSDRGLKKRKTSKDAEPTTGLKNKDSTSSLSKGTKSQPQPSRKSVQSKEPVFEVADSDIPQDQEGNLGDNDDVPRKETASRKCYKALSEKLDWENPEGGDYPFDLSKPLPLITRGRRQKVPVEYFINNDLKYLQGGVSTMTYTTSTTKTKAAHYDLPGIEDVVPNIWSPVKVSYDQHVLWVTHVKVIRKHGYGYLEEIVVRRADNTLYKFKEGDFLRLRINDIKDMLLLVAQNRLTNLSRDDVINVTKPDTTRPDLKKRHPYTPYKDPQGFIYVDDFNRNRLMRSDELYKFSDGTLTRLLTSLEDITNNIDMEYLPRRR